MRRLISFLFWSVVIIGANAAAAGAIVAAAMYPKLPDLDHLEDYRPRLPLQVFSADGELLGEFGEEKRTVVTYDEFPPMLRAALIATEDQDFYDHLGLDLAGIVRTVITRLQGGGGGASTLTMQVARYFYLERIQTYERKVYEILLALKIEDRFSKREILEFYMNQIYLGRGSYGYAAAAEAYYGKEMAELSIGEIAVLAGLPQAPSRLNQLRNPDLVKERQKHVLRRMRDTGLISPDTYLEVASAPLPPLVDPSAQVDDDLPAGQASFVAEEVRKIVFDRFGDETYERGFRIHTTIDMRLQRAAVVALRKGLIDYTLRHSYLGPEQYHDIAGLAPPQITSLLDGARTIGGIEPVIVVSIDEGVVQVINGAGTITEVGGAGLDFISSALKGGGDGPTVRPGAQVRLALLPVPEDELAERLADLDEEEAALVPRTYPAIVQLPQVEGSLVALSPDDGRVLAMVGGFDFAASQYNHVTQALRQPGSSIKPFIYSAALERGYTPATILDDAPFFLTAEQTGSGKSWSPRNYGGKFEGKMMLRDGLARSKNMTTIRVLDSIGPEYAQDFITRFGFDRDSLPPFLTMALGAGEVTPMQLAAGYAVFANGGYLVTPYFVSRIEDYDGNVVTYEVDFAKRIQVIDQRNAFMISDLLRSVVKVGTARRANSLGRGDLAGKTGTTNETVDAWFAGFNPELVAVSWVGYDTPKSLGRIETGSRAALPIWVDFMGAALSDRPDGEHVVPPGIIQARVNTNTGLLAAADEEDSIVEYFYEEYLPSAPAPAASGELLSDELL